MFNWLNELLEIKYKFKERKLTLTPIPDKPVICESCETLKMQLSIANQEKKLLLDKLINPVQPIEQPTASEIRPINPSMHRSWNDKRRALEMNSRRELQLREAKLKEESLINQSNKSDRQEEINKLEKELLEPNDKESVG